MATHVRQRRSRESPARSPAAVSTRRIRPSRPSTRRAANAIATRRALLSQARRLFARRGYTGVSLEEICRRARVTKGALYHHFHDKRDLFRAVCREVEDEWAARTLNAASAERNPIARLLLGCRAVLDGCLDPTVQRILLLEAPAVLDSGELRQIEADRGLGLMSAALERAMEAGELEPQPVAPLARLIMGALVEASLAIARDVDPTNARVQMGSAIERLIEGLRPRARAQGAA
jgi:AcrR family transcriptional regulator